MNGGESYERHHWPVEILRRETGRNVRQVFPDTFDQQIQGTGLGLSLTFGIAADHAEWTTPDGVGRMDSGGKSASGSGGRRILDGVPGEAADNAGLGKRGGGFQGAEEKAVSGSAER